MSRLHRPGLRLLDTSNRGTVLPFRLRQQPARELPATVRRRGLADRLLQLRDELRVIWAVVVGGERRHG